MIERKTRIRLTDGIDCYSDKDTEQVGQIVASAARGFLGPRFIRFHDENGEATCWINPRQVIYVGPYIPSEDAR